MSSYSNYVQTLTQAFLSVRSSAQDAVPSLTSPVNDPIVLIISPHPDDECLMGSYALRLKEECNAKVYVLPFSYGSKVSRQEARKLELKAACAKLGFEILNAPLLQVEDLIKVLRSLNPNVIFSPHAEDGHPVHQKAHEWTRDALQLIAKENQTVKRAWVQTEFWRDLEKPNLLIPLSSKQVIQIGEALACHVEEVKRNPYHLRLPAWFQDQVRKGQEKVGGYGSSAASGGDANVEALSEPVYGQIYLQTILNG